MCAIYMCTRRAVTLGYALCMTESCLPAGLNIEGYLLLVQEYLLAFTDN